MESLLIIAFGLTLIYVAFKLQSSTQKIRKKGIQTEGIIFDTLPSDNPDSPKEFFIKSPLNSFIPILLIVLAIVILATGIYKLLHVQF